MKRRHGLILLVLLFCMAFAGLAQGVEGGETPPEDVVIPPPPPSGISIDYAKEQFKGVSNKIEYSVGESESWTSLANSTLKINDDMLGKAVYFRFKRTVDAIASEAAAILVPQRATQAQVRESLHQLSYDYFKNALSVTESGKFEVTTDSGRSKWAKVSKSVTLTKLVQEEVDTILVRFYGDTKAERFTSEAVEYQFYVTTNHQPDPTISQIAYNGKDELLVGINGHTVAGMEMSYDKKKWTKINSDTVKLSSKLGKSAVTLYVRRPALANEAHRAPSFPLIFQFAPRQATPEEKALTYQLLDDTFTVGDIADEYQIKGEKTWVDDNPYATKIGKASSILVRKKAVFYSPTDILPASASRAFSVPKRAATPKIAYNASSSQVTGVKVGMEYYVTTEKITDKDYYFKGGTAVTAVMLDVDGSFNINDDHNGPRWEGRLLHGKYLHVKVPADVEKGVRESLVAISCYIPDRYADVSSGKVTLDKKREMLVGIDETMEFRFQGETKWATGNVVGEVSVSAWLDKSDSNYSTMYVRYKGTGKGEAAVMASRTLAVYIGMRGTAPNVSYDYSLESIAGSRQDDEALAIYEISTNGKKWTPATRAGLSSAIPKFSKNPKTVHLFVRLAPSDDAVGSKPAKILLAARPQTPSYQLVVSANTGDSIIDLQGNHAKLEFRRSAEEDWQIPSGNIDFTDPDHFVDETAVKYQVRVASITATTPASLPQTISVARQRAPKPSANYKTLVFAGVNDKMQYRIATTTGEGAQTYSVWVDVAYKSGKKVVPVDLDVMGSRNVQFRLKATGKKLASLPSEPVFVLERDSTQPDVEISYDYVTETMYVECVNLEGVLEYSLRMKDASKQKWAKFPANGLALESILDDTGSYVKQEDRAIIKFRIAEQGSGDAYQMPSSDSPEYLVLGRMSKPRVLSYDYATGSVGEMRAGELEYSLDGKTWTLIKRSMLVDKMLPIAALESAQKLYVRRIAVRTGTPKGFASDPYLVTIPAAPKAPTLELSELVDFTKPAEELALTLPQGYEFMVVDTKEEELKNIWIDGANTAFLLMEGDVMVYDASKAVRIQIRSKGSNDERLAPSMVQELTLPKRPGAPSGVKYSASTGVMTGMQASMEYILCDASYEITGWEEATTDATEPEMWISVTAKQATNNKITITAASKAEAMQIYIRHKATEGAPASQPKLLGTTMVKG